jgi:type VI secretion system protein ImpK
MREEVADLVYPVFKLGLDLKERPEPGTREDIDKALTKLKGLLADRRWEEPGDAGPIDPLMSRTVTSLRPGRYLGMRYAVVCWLDEILGLDPHWGEYWRNRALEVAIYNEAERAHRFWEQAERAEVRPGSDALEVYYLCVMLGFRGDYRERPDQLQAWVDRVRPQVIRGYGEEPSQRDSSTPENYVPLLVGRDRFQNMLIAWAWALGLSLLGAGFFIMYLILRELP